MGRWITKNGKHVYVGRRPVYYVTNNTKKETSHYRIVPNTNIRHNVIQTSFSSNRSDKKWYEEGWRKEVFKVPSTDYAVDFGNFGDSNFSFVVRKGKKEIFSLPRYLLKNAVSYGLTTIGVPSGIPFDLPISAVEQGIRLYESLVN